MAQIDKMPPTGYGVLLSEVKAAVSAATASAARSVNVELIALYCIGRLGI